MTRLSTFLSAALLSLFALGAQAQVATFDDYTVYYSVVNSTFIDADIASQYGITRGDRNAFLNISVQKKMPDGSQQAVTATISGHKQNLLQQRFDFEFNEVKEGPAIYYIGEFMFSNRELVKFELAIQPDGISKPYTLAWEATVYIN